MAPAPQDCRWEERLKNELGVATAPDFDAWCRCHSDDVQHLNPVVTAASRRTRRILMDSIKAVAASLLVALGVIWLRSGGALNSAAYAETIPGVDNVQTITWTQTYYARYTSADGKRTWLKPERRLHAYRHPGQYRETMLGEDGNPYAIDITDVRAGKKLTLNLKEKKAVLTIPAGLFPDVRGPFAWVGEALRDRLVAGTQRVKSVELLGTKPQGTGKANVFRAQIDQGEGGPGILSSDFWFDTESKQLVAIHNPGADTFDPATEADAGNPAEKTWSMWVVPGAIQNEIVLDAKLDPALFSLDPPAGFQFEAVARPTVTEEEMIEYLGAAARFNGGAFPDSPYGLAVDREAFNAAAVKDPKDRSGAEQKLIDLSDKYLLQNLNKLPVRHFEEDQTVAKSFRYIGTGVKIGQGDRIVCWYKLRNATKYRAVFGDLSVKDVTEAELPLSVEP